MIVRETAKSLIKDKSFLRRIWRFKDHFSLKYCLVKRHPGARFTNIH